MKWHLLLSGESNQFVYFLNVSSSADMKYGIKMEWCYIYIYIYIKKHNNHKETKKEEHVKST